MTKTTKAAVVPYLSLINFANEVEITPSNWQAVLRRLWEDWVFPAPSPAASGRVSRPFGFAPPAFLDGERIAGPEPLRAVQRELQADLARLTDPDRDPLSLSKGRSRGLSESYTKTPPKTVDWLLAKINILSYEHAPLPVLSPEGRGRSEPQRGLNLPLVLVSHGRLSGAVLVTDRISLRFRIEDLRLWVYFAVALLWAEELLARLGRCRRCRRFFFAPTQAKKWFCSQGCGQNATAAVRGRLYRKLRGGWQEAKDALTAALEEKPHQKSIAAALDRAQAEFEKAFRQKAGPRYEEARAFLISAQRKVRRLRKRR